MASLRSRLYLYLVVSIGPLLALIGLGLGFGITTWLERDFDEALEAKARALIALVRQDVDGRIEFEFAGRFMPEFETPTAPEFFELWLDDDTLFARSNSFETVGTAEQAHLPRRTQPAPAAQFRDLTLPDGRQGRQVQIDFRPETEDERDAETVPPEERKPKAPLHPAMARPTDRMPMLSLIVARGRGELDRQIRLLYSSFAMVGAVLFIASAALIPVLLRSALRPLDSLIRQMRALDGKSIGNRFSLRDAPDEIAPVVSHLNSLLDRLEMAVQRERRLSTDIAHELKTPVAELRNLCEVGGRWPEDTEGVREFFGDARSIALHMERLVAQLLLLARYEEGSQPVRTSEVHVAAAIDASWQPFAELARRRGLEFRNEVSASLRLETDPGLFGLILTNLLSNAAMYSTAGSAVICTSGQNNGRLSLCFANPADSLEPGDIAVMFDRFWRKDDARTAGSNVGLGLSLARVFAELLGLETRAELGADAVLKIHLVQRPSRSP